MNPYAIPPAIAAVLNFALVLWVYQQAPANLIRRTFLLWNTAWGLWNLSIAVGYSATDPLWIFYWYKWTITPVIGFIAPLFLHFVCALTGHLNSRTRWIIPLSYLTGAAVTCMGLFTPLLMGDTLQKFYWGYYPIAGRAEGVHGLAYMTISAYAFYVLIKNLRASTGHRRNQLKYVLYGAAICFGGGTTNFLPLRGIAIYPIGNLLNSLYSLLVAIAIVEYRLMDIRVVFRRGVAYGLMSGALTAVYLSMVALLKQVFGHFGIDEQMVYYTAAVPMTVVLAPAMRARVEPFMEHVPFWKTYHYSQIFREFGQSIMTVLDLPLVAQKTVEKLMSIVGTKSGSIYLASSEEAPTVFTRVFSQGEPAVLLLVEDHPVITNFKSRRNELLKEEVLWQHSELLSNVVQRAWDQWPYALTLPIWAEHQLVGLIALGEKTSGDMFNQDDLHLLRALVNQASVALQNAQDVAEMKRHYKSAKKQQDMALMGVLATEMAHELSKPLTHILNEQVRLQQLSEGKSKPGLEKIEKATMRAVEILQGFAMLSPQISLEKTSVIFTSLIEEALTGVGVLEDSSIKVIRRYETAPEMQVNSVHMVQVLTNVIQNAWQSMRSGGTLEISLKHIIGTKENSFAEIQVLDSGTGIPVELLDRVYEPFFTTKKDNGGRGVGLTICQAIVKRHGGSIRIESPVSAAGGTRVVIQIPLDSKETRTWETSQHVS